MEIKGSVAIVTGAGRGAGRAIALELARRGAKVGLLARSEDELRQVVREIEEAESVAMPVPADVTNEGQVQQAVDRVLGEWGRVDVLVNDAGITRRGPVESMTLEDWRRVLDVNLTGPFLCSRAVIPAMKRQGRGHIISISSGAGKHGYQGLAAYSASKFGLMGLTESLAAELGDLNIKVSVLVPGTIETGFGDRKPRERPAGVKMLRPEDVAIAIAEMVSQSDYAWTAEMNLWPFK